RQGDISARELARARRDFRRAYLASAVKVFAELGVTDLPALPFAVDGNWYPQVSGWEAQVAKNIEYWMRAEFGSIVRVVRDAAAYGQPTLCWQIAARLGDCYSPPVPHADVRT